MARAEWMVAPMRSLPLGCALPALDVRAVVAAFR